MAGKTNVSARSLHFWTDEETEFLLIQVKELNILKLMDRRRTRNCKPFKKVQERMASAGFTRTHEQIRVRWKHVQHAFLNARISNKTGGRAPVVSPFPALLEELLGHRPLAQAGDFGFAPTGSENASGGGHVRVETTMELSTPSSSDSLTSERTITPALQEGTSTPEPRRSEIRTQRRATSEMGVFMDRLEDMQKRWMEAIRESQDREERLVNSVLESNAAVIASLVEGIRSFWIPAPPSPPHTS